MIKQNNKQTIGVGLLSIIVTFVILALTVLGSLSVISARADYKLSKKNGDYLKAYYGATTRAEEMLGELENATNQGSNVITRYYVPIVDNQQLEVVISRENGIYKILSWHVINTLEWQEDQSGFNDIIVEN